MKVLLLDKTHPVLIEMLRKEGFECRELLTENIQEIESVIHEYEGVIVRSKHRVDSMFIDKAVQLQWIGRVGSGMETIDVEYASSKGIVCLNSPEGNRDAVAEHALSMLLCLFNKINLANTEVRSGQWNREANRGIELKGKTIGIIGFGHMGSEFAKRLHSFDCRILAYDKYKKQYAPHYVEETSLKELQEEADIVSLHTPLTNETRFLADNTFFESFQKNIYIINTSRGEVLHTTHLVEQMKKGKIKGACLDVLEYENMRNDSIENEVPESLQYLYQSNQVLLTPHIAGWTVESKVKLAQVLAEKIIDLRRNTSYKSI